jgi:hypothetical protein
MAHFILGSDIEYLSSASENSNGSENALPNFLFGYKHHNRDFHLKKASLAALQMLHTTDG